MDAKAEHNALVDDVEAALNILERRGNALMTHFIDTHPRLNIAPEAKFGSTLTCALRELRKDAAKHRVELKEPEYDREREMKLMRDLYDPKLDRYEVAKQLVAHLATKPK